MVTSLTPVSSRVIFHHLFLKLGSARLRSQVPKLGKWYHVENPTCGTLGAHLGGRGRDGGWNP